MVPCCPACGRQMRISELHHGSLACPWCKEKLRLPTLSRLELSILGGATIIVTVIISFWLPHEQYAPLYVIPLFPLVGAGIFAAWGIFRGFFFPCKLQRDHGWPDDGTILHITSPPEPPKEQ